MLTPSRNGRVSALNGCGSGMKNFDHSHSPYMPSEPTSRPDTATNGT